MPDIVVTPDPDFPACRATVTRPNGAVLGVAYLAERRFVPVATLFTAAELVALAELPGPTTDGSADWTVDPETGRSNSSAAYLQLVDSVDWLIRNSAFDLIAGRSGTVARLIVAQLAHVHGLVPRQALARFATGQAVQRG